MKKKDFRIPQKGRFIQTLHMKNGKHIPFKGTVYNQSTEISQSWEMQF